MYRGDANLDMIWFKSRHNGGKLDYCAAPPAPLSRLFIIIFCLVLLCPLFTLLLPGLVPNAALPRGECGHAEAEARAETPSWKRSRRTDAQFVYVELMGESF